MYKNILLHIPIPDGSTTTTAASSLLALNWFSPPVWAVSGEESAVMGALEKAATVVVYSYQSYGSNLYIFFHIMIVKV